MRSATRQFLGAITDNCRAVMTAAEAKCRGLLRALEWLNSLEHHRVYWKLEMDCKMMVDDVNKDKSNHLEYGVIL